MVQSHTYDNKKKIYKTKAIRNGSNKGYSNNKDHAYYSNTAY